MHPASLVAALLIWRRLRPRPRSLIAVTCLLLLAAACMPIFQAVEVESVDVGEEEFARSFTTPVRAYLSDGSIVVLPDGGRVGSGQLQASGQRYDLTLSDTSAFEGITTDSVVGLEVFRTDTRMEGLTVLGTLASIGAGALAAGALSVAIFGSCPTIYADIAGDTTLQMEAFSYSIAPLFESRDVAALQVLPDSSGLLELELRNEALETHHINHMELFEVVHAPDESAVPGPAGRPLVVGPRRPPLAALDGGGRDVLSSLLERDGDAFRSSRRQLTEATLDDLTDHVDVVLPTSPGAESATLILDLKNTLMNSVLFYDVMLARSGAGAVDWLGSDLDRIGSALEMGSWYQDRMGLRVLVDGERGWEEVAHLADVGPIAWKEVAVEVPTSGRETRIRLEFVTDSWFIDRIQVSSSPRRDAVRRIPVSRVLRSDGSVAERARVALQAPDTSYLITRPSNRYTLEFDVSAGGAGTERTGSGEIDEPTAGETVDTSGVSQTYLLVAQGYYVEWIRGKWLEDSNDRDAFEPDDAAVLEALRRWDDVMDEFERDFHASKISTR